MSNSNEVQQIENYAQFYQAFESLRENPKARAILISEEEGNNLSVTFIGIKYAVTALGIMELAKEIIVSDLRSKDNRGEEDE